MSEPLRDLAASDEYNIAGPNYFGYYIHEIATLLSNEDDFDPISFQNPNLSAENRDKDTSKHIIVGAITNSLTSTSSLFSNFIGCGLSDFKKERLKGLLKQSARVLTLEVDEMLDSVIATRKLFFHLRDNKHPLSNSAIASEDDASKRLKLSLSSCSSGVHVHSHPPSDGFRREGVETANSKFSDVAALGKEESYATKKSFSHCNTSETPIWRTGSEGAEICNACENKVLKETPSTQTKNGEKGSLFCSANGSDKVNDEVSEDLKFLLENDRSQVEQTMKKYSGELWATLDHMEQLLEGLLNTVTAECRPMTLLEKQKLQNMIQNLPPENLDRVVEIIKRGKSSDNDNEIFVDLEEEDDSTLWRLYYYVEAFVNAKKLSSM